jgi:hypothetical protein
MKKHIVFLLFLVNVNSLISQVLEDKKLINYEGYFNFKYDTKSDKIYLDVTRLNEEFLYVNSLATGVGSNDIGLDRGQLGSERVVKFIKAGNKLLLIQPNLNYRAITENDLEKKSIEQAFAKSVLFGFKIEQESNGIYTIDLTPFLMLDAHGVTENLKSKNEGVYKFDSSKSALSLERTKAFPKNVEFEALLTFEGEPKGKQLKTVTPTPSLVSVIQHHSFIELPDSNYKPRAFDVRSGAISISYMDYATPVQESITKRFITRHRLEKKYPDQELSEAVEPIIYYLDPGTPEPIRSALLEGASWWNEAFTSIGFKDAFQVKILPEDADPMDCRYNVIQWVHRSTRGWSYGGSVIDPRTGEIIKGHVSLGSLRIRQDFLIAQALLNKPYAKSNDNYQPMLEMALARIRQLSAHEVGHTIGFAHNFAASTNDRASVMDYPHPKITLDAYNQIDLSNAYATGIGLWDKVTVAYSYSVFKDSINEENTLQSILENAQNDGLRFITDSDARAEGGAHALAHLWDNGKNASEELLNVLNVRKYAISNFSKDNIKSGEPYTVLEDVFVPLYFYHRYQTEATIKLIGGLDYNYAVKGDGQIVTQWLEDSQQTKALQAVLKTLSVNELAIPIDKLNLFPPRAFNYERTRESFKSHAGVAFDPFSIASTSSDMTLRLLLHPERVNRLVYYGSLDRYHLNLKSTLNELLKASIYLPWNEKRPKDPYADYYSEIQQIINNNVLAHIMNLAVSDKVYFQVNAIANETLKEISQKIDVNNRYAFQYKLLIDQFFKNPEKFKLQSAPKIPDGSPIGSDSCFYTTN